jgi:hypothetical protein
MLVRAIKMGYCGNVRRKEGTVFELEDKLCLNKEGKFQLPKWVEAVDVEEKPKKKAREKQVIDTEVEVI